MKYSRKKIYGNKKSKNEKYYRKLFKEYLELKNDSKISRTYYQLELYIHDTNIKDDSLIKINECLKFLILYSKINGTSFLYSDKNLLMKKYNEIISKLKTLLIYEDIIPNNYLPFFHKRDDYTYKFKYNHLIKLNIIEKVIKSYSMNGIHLQSLYTKLFKTGNYYRYCGGSNYNYLFKYRNERQRSKMEIKKILENEYDEEIEK